MAAGVEFARHIVIQRKRYVMDVKSTCKRTGKHQCSTENSSDKEAWNAGFMSEGVPDDQWEELVWFAYVQY